MVTGSVPRVGERGRILMVRRRIRTASVVREAEHARNVLEAEAPTHRRATICTRKSFNYEAPNTQSHHSGEPERRTYFREVLSRQSRLEAAAARCPGSGHSEAPRRRGTKRPRPHA